MRTESEPSSAPHDPFADVLDFHRKFGVLALDRPAIPSDDVVKLRLSLIDEEAGELREALGRRDLVATADAIADLLYVVYGTAVSFGIDIRPVFDEVHRTNMAKVGGATRADGKVLKPEGWRSPEIAPILARMGLSEDDGQD